jgi:hypothetical protein
MAQRTILIVLGLVVLGIVVLAVGAITQPNANSNRAVTYDGKPYTTVDNYGVALIALGLTFIAVGLGFFLAWTAERAMASGMM